MTGFLPKSFGNANQGVHRLRSAWVRGRQAHAAGNHSTRRVQNPGSRPVPRTHYIHRSPCARTPCALSRVRMRAVVSPGGRLRWSRTFIGNLVVLLYAPRRDIAADKPCSVAMVPRRRRPRIRRLRQDAAAIKSKTMWHRSSYYRQPDQARVEKYRSRGFTLVADPAVPVGHESNRTPLPSNNVLLSQCLTRR